MTNGMGVGGADEWDGLGSVRGDAGTGAGSGSTTLDGLGRLDRGAERGGGGANRPIGAAREAQATALYAVPPGALPITLNSRNTLNSPPTRSETDLSHRLYLLPQRAVWWPAQRTLLVADVHLGKGASFRALGQPVPRGSSAATLAALSHLIDALDADRLVVLGDWWHSAHGISPALAEAVTQWRQRHARLVCGIVQGNHDRRALASRSPRAAELARLHQTLALHWLTAPHMLAPGLLALHEPPEPLALPSPQGHAHGLHAHVRVASDTPGGDVRGGDGGGPNAAGDEPAAWAMCGHIHPVMTLRNGRLDRVRVPAFVHLPRWLLLPAFGAFTGGWAVDGAALAQTGGRVYVTDGTAVRLVPPELALR